MSRPFSFTSAASSWRGVITLLIRTPGALFSPRIPCPNRPRPNVKLDSRRRFIGLACVIRPLFVLYQNIAYRERDKFCDRAVLAAQPPGIPRRHTRGIWFLSKLLLV
jgi:hypothetical protein